MNAKRKTGGRPQMLEGKRTKKIDVRFTEDEFGMILKMEKTLGISRTDLIRMRVLENLRPVIVNARELIAAIDAIGTELARCGNNINQLAHHANILEKKGHVDVIVLERFNGLFSDFIKNQHALEVCMRQVIRLSGR